MLEIDDNRFGSNLSQRQESPMMLRRLSSVPLPVRVLTGALLVGGLANLAALPLSGAPVRKLPARRPAHARKPATPAKPTTPAPVAPTTPPVPAAVPISAATLGTTLKAQGYEPLPEGEYQRLKVEEEEFGYIIDLSVSKSGDWLVCMAHLETIPDLTKVPSSPLLALLSANDTQMGRYFSYNRASGQVMLNAALPTRGLAPEELKSQIEAMKETVRDTRGLWDPHHW